jgi:hypothetical protein
MIKPQAWKLLVMQRSYSSMKSTIVVVSVRLACDPMLACALSLTMSANDRATVEKEGFQAGQSGGIAAPCLVNLATPPSTPERGRQGGWGGVRQLTPSRPSQSAVNPVGGGGREAVGGV